jgi:hypothetical protein
LRQFNSASKHTTNYEIMSARTDVEATQNQLSSGVTPESLKATLFEKLEAQHVDIQDLSGNRDKTHNLFLRLQYSCDARWMRPNVRSHHCITAVRKEDFTRSPSSCQQHPQSRNRCHPRLDTQVHDSCRMGNEEGFSLIVTYTHCLTRQSHNVQMIPLLLFIQDYSTSS